MYLVIRLWVYQRSSLRSLQRLFDLLDFTAQVSLEVPAQRHAGVFRCLSAGEDLIVAQQRALVLRVQNLQSANLQNIQTTTDLRRTLQKISILILQ